MVCGSYLGTFNPLTFGITVEKSVGLFFVFSKKEEIEYTSWSFISLALAELLDDGM